MRFKKKKLMMILIMCVLSIISAVILAFSVASEAADSSLLDFVYLFLIAFLNYEKLVPVSIIYSNLETR